MKKKLSVGDSVVNPDIRNDKSPNYVGSIERLYWLNMDGKKSRFAWVKFRDYDGGYSVTILKKATVCTLK